jgi:hypothetical protein
LGLGAATALGGVGADKIALHIGETSEYRQHQATSAGAGVVAPWLRPSSQHRDAIGLFEIACLAENLDVFCRIAAAFYYRDDVVKMEFLI